MPLVHGVDASGLLGLLGAAALIDATRVDPDLFEAIVGGCFTESATLA
jgi:hypothetical protein